GPHGFYWFQLSPASTGAAAVVAAPQRLPELPLARTIDRVLAGRPLAALLTALPAWLRSRRWFGAKARRIRAISLRDVIPLPETDDLEARLCLFEIEYVEGEPDVYVLPLALADAVRAERLAQESPGSEIASLPDGRVLYDAFVDPRTGPALLSLLDRGRRVHGSAGSLGGVRTRAFRSVRGSARDRLPVAPIRAEQSNTSVIFGDRLILKLYRRVEPGVNPDFEVGRLLTEHDFAHTPPVAGALEYRPTGGDSITLGILQGYVPNESDAWSYTLDSVDQAYERALALNETPAVQSPSVARLLAVGREGLSPDVVQWIGGYLESARLLGVRTAEMHRALATSSDDPAFRPEAINSFFQRSIYQGIRTQLRETFSLLSRRRDLVPADEQAAVDAALRLEGPLLERLKQILAGPIGGRRIRIHGDYHAGQVLWTGSDFVIIDFEGEPGRPLGERRLKRSPLRDVAGMLRSFHYAAYGTLLTDGLASATRPEDVPRLQPWARLWYESVAATFLRAYLDALDGFDLLPTVASQLVTLLDSMLLQKVLYEVVYELNNRPTWTSIPLRGLLELAEAPDSTEPPRLG
ncbi:MAG: maltose alpha-D-glucosyltransferase / alpha-amylase, partial [Chloroflexota bacterium]|nr:maltose alpha-D-glucosyltransferase / alpha-amylase [Chloroflexota bacterium]